MGSVAHEGFYLHRQLLARRLPRDRTRLKVTVDVGILRPGDRTAARMGSMFAAMESVACERFAVVFDAGAELRLPAPLASEDDVRPAKRRRVTGKDCPICCEALEQGLAAWPRCSHIFHASCLGEYLVRGHQECPMCRSGLQADMSAAGGACALASKLRGLGERTEEAQPCGDMGEA